MSMTDPISDMLTRIRNANMRLSHDVSMPSLKAKEEVAKILAAEGFIGGFEVAPANPGKATQAKPAAVVEKNARRSCWSLSAS